MMNLDPIYAEYDKQWRLDKEDKEDYVECLKFGKGYKDGPRVTINYWQIEEMIREEARRAYPEFSAEKINYIWSKVYDDYHSSFSDCIGGMSEYCEFVKNLPK